MLFYNIYLFIFFQNLIKKCHILWNAIFHFFETFFTLHFTVKMATAESSDDDSDGELFGSLFKPKDQALEIFYFTSIISVYDERANETEITFNFNYAREVDIFSKVFIIGRIDSSTSRFLNIIVSIGMCSMTWYWMGFATPRIILEFGQGGEGATSSNIETDKCVTDIGRLVKISRGQVLFWEHLFNHVLQEFLYVNKLERTITIEVSDLNDDTSDDVSLSSDVDDVRAKLSSPGSQVLVPLGGGKGT